MPKAKTYPFKPDWDTGQALKEARAEIAAWHHIEVTMPYIAAISCNHYQAHSTRQVVGEDGNLKHIPIMHKTKAVLTWEKQLHDAVFLLFMSELNKQGRDVKAPESLEITIDASFPDRRRRDTGNLVKVINDVIQSATGIDDCNYRTIANPPVFEKRNYGLFSWPSGRHGSETVEASGEISVRVSWK